MRLLINVHKVVLLAIILVGCEAGVHEGNHVVEHNGVGEGATTADSPFYLTNSVGDTLETSVPVLATPDTLDMGSQLPPSTAALPAFEAVELLGNTFPVGIPDTLFRANADSLWAKTVTLDTASLQHIPNENTTTACQFPEAIKAKPSRYTDNARYDIQYIDSEQGLPTSYAFSLYEDRKGNLWISTSAGGVARYDGESFFQFSEKSGFGQSYVRAIHEDSHENMWFGVDEVGVIKFDGRVFENYQLNGGAQANVRSIFEDHLGHLWFGTNGKGVYRFNGEYFVGIGEQEGLRGNSVNFILQDRRNHLWLSNASGGVARFNGETLEYLRLPSQFGKTYINCLLEDENGSIWIGTNKKGLLEYNSDHGLLHYTTANGLPSNQITKLYYAADGLWVGTGEGVACLTPEEEVVRFRQQEGLTSGQVNDLMVGRQDKIWVATFGGGLNIIKPASFRSFTEKDGLSKLSVSTMQEGFDDDIWLGFTTGGIDVLKGNSVYRLPSGESLCSSCTGLVSVIAKRSDNAMLLAIPREGVLEIKDGMLTQYTTGQGLPSNDIRSICPTRDGGVWLGSYGGGAVYWKDSELRHFHDTRGLHSNIITSVLEDAQGRVWFGSSGKGVSYFDGTHFHHMTTDEGLSHNKVYAIYEDARGRLWLGTEGGGISIYHESRWEYLTIADGLPSNKIWGIAQDGNGNVWVSTDNGLACVMASEKADTTEIKDYRVIAYGIQDGVKSMDYYPNSVLHDSKGRMWWGGGKGLAMLNTQEFHYQPPPSTPPSMVLHHLTIKDSSYNFHSQEVKDLGQVVFAEATPFYNVPNGLELAPHQDHVTFHFAAIDYSTPHLIEYQYRLEGQDEGWVKTTQPLADYRNLEYRDLFLYKEYTFQVAARRKGEDWGTTFEYNFKVKTPWYRTLPAFLLYLIMGLVLVGGYVRFHTFALRRRQRSLETEVSMRTRELDDVIEQLNHRKGELESTLKELQATQELLVESEKMASLGVLSAGIAHEINNIVNVINSSMMALETKLGQFMLGQGKLDSYVLEQLNPEQRATLERLRAHHKMERNKEKLFNQLGRIKHGAEQTEEIVRGLRSYSHMDDGEFTRLNVAAELKGTLGFMANQFKAGVMLETHIDDHLPEINGNRGQLNQVIINLVRNALDAMHGQGTLTVSTRLDTETLGQTALEISVQDTGSGIASTIASKIFEPLFTTKQGKGTGLGLYMSYGIIQKHGGKLSFESKVGQGTTFFIHLPIPEAATTTYP